MMWWFTSSTCWKRSLAAAVLPDSDCEQSPTPVPLTTHQAHSMPRQKIKLSLLIHDLGMLLPLLQDIPDGLFRHDFDKLRSTLFHDWIALEIQDEFRLLGVLFGVVIGRPG